MRRIRTAVAASCLLAAALTSCASSAGAKAEPSPSASVTTTDPTPADSPTPTPTPETTEEKLDALVAEKGWVFDDQSGDSLDGTPLYDSPSAYVQDVCDSLPAAADDVSTAAQWLAEGQAPTKDEWRILKAGVKALCPSWSKTVASAEAGTYERWYSDGKYEVRTSKAADTIPPGTYRTKGDLSDCYWERLTRSGEIIDNNFASAAREITVTLRASDGLFTSESCGTWKPVK